MYLYEAMLRGAKLRGQCTGMWFRDDKSCALGSIWEGLDNVRFTNTQEWESALRSLVKKYPILGVNYKHPRYNLAVSLKLIITDLNDTFRCTREAIAEWLKPIELEYERKQLTLKSNIKQCVSKQSIQPLERTKETVK